MEVLMKIKDTITINKQKSQSRIVMPPLVCFNWSDDKGYETVSRAKHYGVRSKDTGLIVVEATAISPEGRFSESMLGLWEDGQIKQCEGIAAACHKENALVIIQLVHGGFQAYTNPVYSASVYEKKDKTVLAMTLEQINQVKEDFVSSSVRAYKSGLDGVEIHGAHTYLLNQFTSSKTNHRTDEYGGSLENRCRLPLEIIKAVRAATHPDFIIGYRFGCNDETFKEDIYLLKALDQASVDFFNVSAGFISADINVPVQFPYNHITYMGVYLKDYTEKPLACVSGIKTEAAANHLIEHYNVPMVAVGRAMLADPHWSTRAINHQPINKCYDCKPRCKYGVNGQECPQFEKEWFQ